MHNFIKIDWWITSCFSVCALPFLHCAFDKRMHSVISAPHVMHLIYCSKLCSLFWRFSRLMLEKSKPTCC